MSFLLRPHGMFLILGLAFSLAYLLATPPFRGPDEAAHVKRAFELLHPGTQGRTPIPEAMLAFKQESAARNGKLHRGDETMRYRFSEIADMLHAPLQPERRSMADLSGSSSAYTPIPYLGTLPALGLALELELPPVAVLWSARLGGLLAGLLGTALAIRAFPALAWPLCLFALMPMTGFLRGMVSADTLTIALAWGYVAWVARLMAGEGRIALRDITLLCVLSCALCLSKTAYVPLAALALAIGPARFGGRMRHLMAMAAAVLPGVVLALAWTLWVKAQFYAFSGPEPVRGSWPDGQLRFILSEPLAYLAILRDTLVSRHFAVNVLLREFAGAFCYQDRYLPTGFALAYWGAGAWLLWQGSGLRLSPMQRLWILAVALGSLMLALTLLYLQWTAYRAPLAMGFQGRYLIPLLPLLLLAIAPARLRLAPRWRPAAVAALTVAANAAGLWVIVQGDYR